MGGEGGTRVCVLRWATRGICVALVVPVVTSIQTAFVSAIVLYSLFLCTPAFGSEQNENMPTYQSVKQGAVSFCRPSVLLSREIAYFCRHIDLCVYFPCPALRPLYRQYCAHTQQTVSIDTPVEMWARDEEQSRARLAHEREAADQARQRAKEIRTVEEFRAFLTLGGHHGYFNLTHGRVQASAGGGWGGGS